MGQQSSANGMPGIWAEKAWDKNKMTGYALNNPNELNIQDVYGPSTRTIKVNVFLAV